VKRKTGNMALKGQKTMSDFLEWEKMHNIVLKLERDGDLKICLTNRNRFLYRITNIRPIAVKMEPSTKSRVLHHHQEENQKYQKCNHPSTLFIQLNCFIILV